MSRERRRREGQGGKWVREGEMGGRGLGPGRGFEGVWYGLRAHGFDTTMAPVTPTVRVYATGVLQ